MKVKHVLIAAITLSFSLFLVTVYAYPHELDKKEVVKLSGAVQPKSEIQEVSLQTIIPTEAPTIALEEPETITEAEAQKREQSQTANLKEVVNVIKKSIYTIKNFSEKTYMDWQAITNKTSPQYSYIRDHMTVCEDGFLRDEYGNIGVALGSYFGEIGTTYEFVLDTGKVIRVVKIEEKADKDTVKGYYHKIDNSIIEFVVDTNSEELKSHTYSNGYIWSGNFNNCPDYNGKISEIYQTHIIKEVIYDESDSNRNN